MRWKTRSSTVGISSDESRRESVVFDVASQKRITKSFLKNTLKITNVWVPRIRQRLVLETKLITTNCSDTATGTNNVFTSSPYKNKLPTSVYLFFTILMWTQLSVLVCKTNMKLANLILTVQTRISHVQCAYNTCTYTKNNV